MLQINRLAGSETSDPGRGRERSLSEVIRFAGHVGRRQLPLILIVMTCAILLAFLYLLTTPSMYTGVSSLVIDTRKVQLFQQQSVIGDIPVVDPGTVQTELEILKSDNVSLAVIKDLDLAHDPEFVPQSSGVIGAAMNSVTRLFSTQNVPTEDQLLGQALSTFESRESVARNGLTYVINISFRSLDPQKAARIANGIANAYINEQLDSKFQATKRASTWLQNRLQELKTQANAAEKAIVDFKQKNNIHSIDSTGKLLSDQQMSEVSGQLITAHSATAEAKARMDRINEITAEAVPDASVADALKNEVIIKLRGQYLDLQSREALWSQRYGANHLATVQLRNQMQEVRRSISDELKKIGQGYKSDYDIALARENALKESLASSVSQSNLSGQAQIQLKELESTSQSLRTIYDRFLQRYTEAVQQESFPITEAHLISPASPPSSRSSPKTFLVVAGAILAGLAVSFGVACLREFADRVFRSSRQVEDKLNLDCLTVLPSLKGARRIKSAGTTDPSLRKVAGLQGVWRHVLDEPFSQYSEGLRAVKVAADLATNSAKANKVIGFTSTLPTEGKSMTSINFVELLAHSGVRVLLIDGDLRNPSTTRLLAPNSEAGLVEVIAGTKTFQDAVWRDPVSGFYFLPSSGDKKLVHTSEVLGSERAKQTISQLREKFDYVVMDLAPLAPVVDTRTTASYIDNFVYVIEWGQTRIEVIEHVLDDTREIYNKILGVVLNKADLGVLGRYELHRSRYYFKNYYGAYQNAA